MLATVMGRANKVIPSEANQISRLRHVRTNCQSRSAHAPSWRMAARWQNHIFDNSHEMDAACDDALKEMAHTQLHEHSGQPAKKSNGCLIAGIIAAVIAVVGIIAVIAVGMWGYGKVKERVATDPAEVITMSNAIAVIDPGDNGHRNSRWTFSSCAWPRSAQKTASQAWY